jgi:hypothetical protein
MNEHGRAPTRTAHAIAIVLLPVIAVGCVGEPTPQITSGIDGCASCGMVIDRGNEAAGWVDGREFMPFCSPGCLLTEYDALRHSDRPKPQTLFFADYNSGAFSTSAETAFLLTDHVPTVMSGRVVCFGSLAAADAMRQHDDETVTDWTGFRIRRGTPDTVIEAVFGPDGMVPDSVVANKGDIVLWRYSGEDLTQDMAWTITGYPEVEPPLVTASGETAEVRFMAKRPGAGFPIERATGGKPLGMLKVSGAHTLDEAAQ